MKGDDKMKLEEYKKFTELLRTGKIKIILQHETNSKQNKELIFNSCTTISEKPIIYLVER